MNATPSVFGTDCRTDLDRYFKAHPNPAMQKQAHKALRLLKASGRPLKARPRAGRPGSSTPEVSAISHFQKA